LDAVKGVSFAVREGEIVGIAGVAGNGQTELVEALTGLRRVEKGRVLFRKYEITGKDPKTLRDFGIFHIPEDRLRRGLVTAYPAYFNVILGRHMMFPFSKNGFLDHKEIRKFAEELFERFDVRPRNVDLPAENFSGGNQQKLIVARELSFSPKLLIVAQPTRGLDVGAIEFIHRTLLSMRDSGVGILLVSMELDEIFSLSDRILVMYGGEVMGEVKPEETTMEEVGLMMTGHRLEEIRR